MSKIQFKSYKKLFKKLRVKYRLVLLNDVTFEERLSFRLSRLNVFVVAGLTAIILIFGTIFLVAYTPLKEYIPGYSSVKMQRDLYGLVRLADSLEVAMWQKDQYIKNIHEIIEGKPVEEVLDNNIDTTKDYTNIQLVKSKEDSLLREEVEKANAYAVSELSPGSNPISSLVFFPPVQGIVTSKFHPLEGHFGIDFAGNKDETIKATLEGIVVYADWTYKTGFIIGIQHQNDLFSTYKHNSSLLVKQGDKVNAGQPIAIIGNSGEQSSGPHLHFELWHRGKAVDPSNYISLN